MYTVSETIEDGNICVTGHASIWAKENVLLWPPQGSNIDRKNIVTPGPDWTPHTCRILRDNIETFEEALEVERMYSKHRDSNSFREDCERKKNKRDHPVNSNQSDLIDVNELINEIDNNTTVHAPEKSAPKTTMSNVNDAKSSQKVKPYHSRCLQQSGRVVKKRVVSGSEIKKLNAKKPLKSEISKLKKRDGQDSDKVKVPRYPNYLKSGKKSSVPTSIKSSVPTSIKSSVPTSTMKSIAKTSTMKSSAPTSTMKSCAPTSTITKAEYLKLNGETSDGKEVPVRENIGRVALSDRQETFDDFDSVAHGGRGKAMPTFGVADDMVMHPRASFEENVSKCINDLQNAQKRAEEKRVIFEARMIVKWDAFVDDMKQIQGRTQSRGQKQHVEVEPVRSIDNQVDPVSSTEDDFEDLDEMFPIKVKSGVEKFEWNLRQDLDFKLRLKSRSNEFIAESAKKTIRLMLKYLIRDTVLELYSWNGTAKKGAFKKLKSINSFLYGFISEHFKKFKKLQYESYMGQWLKQARGRQRKITYTYPKRKDEMDDTDDDSEANEDQDEDEDSDIED